MSVVESTTLPKNSQVEFQVMSYRDTGEISEKIQSQFLGLKFCHFQNLNNFAEILDPTFRINVQKIFCPHRMIILEGLIGIFLRL
jgi:hypothetical protein